MSYYTGGFTKNYCFVSDIYLLTCLDFQFYIIIFRSDVASGHGKDVVGGKNARDKMMPKLAKANIFSCSIWK